MKKPVLVTSNSGKAREFQLLFEEAGLEIEIEPMKTVEIQADSLEEIAVFSSLQAYNLLKRPVIVEDAGLFVESLNGFPGPYSSYVYKTLGAEGLLKLVGEDRRAHFESVIAFYSREHGVKVFRGICRGRIAYEVRGTSGFGFDPIFIPENMNKTFAELGEVEKNKISHRGRAARKLVEWLKDLSNL